MGKTDYEELKDLAIKISHNDDELTPNDILSTIEALLKIGASKIVILKCQNIEELKAVGIYQNVLNRRMY